MTLSASLLARAKQGNHRQPLQARAYGPTATIQGHAGSPTNGQSPPNGIVAQTIPNNNNGSQFQLQAPAQTNHGGANGNQNGSGGVPNHGATGIRTGLAGMLHATAGVQNGTHHGGSQLLTQHHNHQVPMGGTGNSPSSSTASGQQEGGGSYGGHSGANNGQVSSSNRQAQLKSNEPSYSDPFLSQDIISQVGGGTGNQVLANVQLGSQVSGGASVASSSRNSTPNHSQRPDAEAGLRELMEQEAGNLPNQHWCNTTGLAPGIIVTPSGPSAQKRGARQPPQPLLVNEYPSAWRANNKRGRKGNPGRRKKADMPSQQAFVEDHHTRMWDFYVKDLVLRGLYREVKVAFSEWDILRYNSGVFARVKMHFKDGLREENVKINLDEFPEERVKRWWEIGSKKHGGKLVEVSLSSKRANMLMALKKLLLRKYSCKVQSEPLHPCSYSRI